jgi:catechol 2,3-dioxygenase-like lactoylglutathione lyase family enzyme
MDNVGIVVEDIDAAIAFFTELGLELEGRAPIEGSWADGVTGLPGMRVEIAMMRTPDGHGRLELSRFLAPAAIADHRTAPVNSLGYLRVMFAVEDIDDTLERLGKRGAKLPRGFSSGSPSNSGRRRPGRIRCEGYRRLWGGLNARRDSIAGGEHRDIPDEAVLLTPGDGPAPFHRCPGTERETRRPVA